ncbi:hypothetical protein VTN00DRAFT_9886 [Thermoascus crustaceus]|uniref:uncharacterized protein n=1 Tax=Thermoascus crustaceus TaxID=5088 RepID=UPI003743F3DB
MVRTRAQERFDEQQGSNPTEPATQQEQQNLPNGPTSEKRKWDDRKDGSEDQDEQKKQENGSGAELPPTKAAKASEEDDLEPENAPADDGYGDDDKYNKSRSRSGSAVSESVSSKLRKTIADYGALPLQGTAVKEPLKPEPETILAMVIDALLKSTRISHDLAQRAVNTVIEAGYHDIKKLSESTWDERVDVLARAGYNRYREQNATRLGDLAEWVIGEYDGDLNNLLKRADCKQQRVKSSIKEIKGLGDLGTDLFINNVQAVWPCLAPFLDSRSLKTAEEVGIGTDLDAIYAELGHDPVEMSKLALGLSNVRLEKKQGAIAEEG